MTLLIAPLMVRDVVAAHADARAARDLGADLVEYRIDELFTGDAAPGSAESRLVRTLLADSPLPCVLTCRPAWEGGGYEGDEESRLELLLNSITSLHPPRYLDLELAAFDRAPDLEPRLRNALHAAGDNAPSVVLSLHDFAGRPADLTRRLLRLADLDFARVHKIAFRARSLRDNLELFELTRAVQKPTIALGMGEFGLMSRVLAPKFSGFATFASLRREDATAPGQPTLRELINRYRFKAITPSTALYGVVGWPVAHSLSPAVHNAAFEALEQDAVYLPLPVAASDDPEASYGSLKATLLSLLGEPALTLRGLSVTIPHKVRLVRLAREEGWALGEGVEAIGAANTLVVGGDGATRLENTDATAVRDLVQQRLPGRHDLRIAVIGAGGMARAVAWALAPLASHIVICNRSPGRAQALAAELAGHIAAPLASASLSELPTDADLYAQCTPVGMAGGPAPQGGAIPDSLVKALPRGTCVLETVYRADGTPLARSARRRGLEVIDGQAVFVEQAARQSELFTGRPAPVQLIRRTAEEQL